jgi:hypothetical protein
MGLGYFNLGRVYNVLNYLGDASVANRAFLNAVVARGIPIYLGAQPVAQTGGYAMELEYLFNLGVPNGALIPAW